MEKFGRYMRYHRLFEEDFAFYMLKIRFLVRSNSLYQEKLCGLSDRINHTKKGGS